MSTFRRVGSSGLSCSTTTALGALWVPGRGQKVLGGVSRVNMEQRTTFTDWTLPKEVRTALNTHVASVHPIAWEYVNRLHRKNRELTSVMEDAASQGVAADEFLRVKLRNVSSNTPFNLSRWRQMFQHELDATAEVADDIQQMVDCQEMLSRASSALLTHSAAIAGSNLDGSRSARNDEDAREMVALCEEELSSLLEKIKARRGAIEEVVARRVESSDVLASSSSCWTISVTGRAGGLEASLFADELREMLRAYCKMRGWRVSSGGGDGSSGAANGGGGGGDHSPPGGGNAPDTTSLLVEGDGVYQSLRHEIGVHKVQRVPVTDADGKMQTSTAVVTLMPILDPVRVNVEEQDCKIEFVRGSGPGGQGMQSSSNCCVLTHMPSGITVKCHGSRSALGNKDMALQLVAQQILAKKVRAQQSSRDSVWSNQWTSGERSEKMRTYNFPQNRLTDHRLGRDYALTTFLESPQLLFELHRDLNEVSVNADVDNALSKVIAADFGSDG